MLLGHDNTRSHTPKIKDFFIFSLAGLNDAQRSAASVIEGPVLILAGAGSGKTRTLTYRIAHMVLNYNIPGKEILAVSFTNKAAKEMKDRVKGLIGTNKMRGMTLATFHSLGVKILRQFIERLGYEKNFSIYDTSDQLSIIREALKIYHADKKYDNKTILSKIGYLKNSGVGAEEFIEGPHFNEEDPYDLATEYCYRFYQDKLKFYNAIDFDDILHLTVKLLKENPDVTEEVSKKFKYIMIDEYQDTNQLQLDLILSLTKTHDNLCVVGDDDQSIYSFRGADIRNILEFERHFPAAKVIKLEENYRSNQEILDLSNKVIKENKDRRDKTLFSQKRANVIPELWMCADSDHEAEIVADDISKYQANGGHLGDIAILYRSNTQAQIFEEILRMNETPYVIYGGQKFYEKKEVKDLIAFLCLINNQKDSLSLRRILNIPNRGIGNATLEKYLKYSEEHNIALFDALVAAPDLGGKNSDNIIAFTKLILEMKEAFTLYPLAQNIMTLIERLSYLDYIKNQHENAKQVERRQKDVMIFVESAERFTKFHKNHATLKNFIERLLLQDNADKENLDEENEDGDVRKNEVTLMTLHTSKGLEFEKVYLVGVEEETLPHKKSILEGQGISEERRLCYVGITRARDTLIMTYCKERMLYGKKVPRHPSRFVVDLEKINLLKKRDMTTFGDMSEQEISDFKKNFFEGLWSKLDD